MTKLREWSKLWLETSGVNTLRAEISDEDGKITSFAVRQSFHPDYPTLRPHRLGIGYYNLANGKLVRTHRVEVDVDGELTEIPELVGTIRPDLILLNDGDLTYTKIRLDEKSWQTTLNHSRSFLPEVSSSSGSRSTSSALSHWYFLKYEARPFMKFS